MNRLNQYEYIKEARSVRFNQSFGDRQKGMTAIAMVLILVLVAFFALIAIRLLPIYIENYSVSSHLKRTASESETKTRTDKEIISTLRKRFEIDDVTNVDKEDIVIKREGGTITVTIEYEVRTPALANVDMVVSFKEEAVVK